MVVWSLDHLTFTSIWEGWNINESQLTVNFGKRLSWGSWLLLLIGSEVCIQWPCPMWIQQLSHFEKKTCTFWPRYKRLVGRSYGKRPSSWHGKWHLKIVLFMDLTSVAPANASWRSFRCKWRTPSCTLCTGAWRSMRSVMAWHLQRLQTANVEKNCREMPSSLEIWHTHTHTSNNHQQYLWQEPEEEFLPGSIVLFDQLSETGWVYVKPNSSPKTSQIFFRAIGLPSS